MTESEFLAEVRAIFRDAPLSYDTRPHDDDATLTVHRAVVIANDYVVRQYAVDHHGPFGWRVSEGEAIRVGQGDTLRAALLSYALAVDRAAHVYVWCAADARRYATRVEEPGDGR